MMFVFLQWKTQEIKIQLDSRGNTEYLNNDRLVERSYLDVELVLTVSNSRKEYILYKEIWFRSIIADNMDMVLNYTVLIVIASSKYI